MNEEIRAIDSTLAHLTTEFSQMRRDMAAQKSDFEDGLAFQQRNFDDQVRAIEKSLSSTMFI
jgi:hypothetical protein